MNRSVAVLLVLNLLLAALLGALWYDSSRYRWQLPVAVVPDPAAFAAPPGLPRPPGLSAYPEVLARPVFVPWRRPPPPPPKDEAAAGVDALDGIELLGLLDAGQATAIIARVDGAPRRLVLNERIGAWTFTGIDEHEALFESPSGQTRRLPFIHHGRNKGVSLRRRRRLQGVSPARSAPHQPMSRIDSRENRV